jgi:hypothetical protein
MKKKCNRRTKKGTEKRERQVPRQREDKRILKQRKKLREGQRWKTDKQT